MASVKGTSYVFYLRSVNTWYGRLVGVSRGHIAETDRF